MKKEVNYREDVSNLVDDIKEQLLSEFMKSENKDDKDRIKWMILDGRSLDMFVATAEKLQTIQDSLDILMAALIKEGGLFSRPLLFFNAENTPHIIERR